MAHPNGEEEDGHRREKIRAIIERMDKLEAGNVTIKKFLGIYEYAAPEPEKIDNKIKSYQELFANFEELTAELKGLDTDNQYYDRYNIKGQRLKLPQSTLPSFNGAYEKWLTFKGEFGSMIHDQDDVTDVDKLSYLRRALTGPAFDKIKMLPITAENYARAWKLLDATYSDQRLIISRHLNLLMNLPKQEHETSKGLSQLMDDTRQHYEMLKVMGVELSEEIIVTILENKLHRSTADDWDETIPKGTFPALSDLLNFLSRRASRLAIRHINKVSSEINQHLEPTRFSSTQNHFNVKKNDKRTYAQAFITNTSSACSHCRKEPHPLFMCAEFKSLPASKRLKVAREQSYCINCLRNNHQVAECYSPRNCRLCEERHNTSLHHALLAEKTPQATKGMSSQSQSIKDQSPSILQLPTKQISFIAHPPSDQIVLSAMVDILDQNKRPIKCRVLLDTASTANFITERLAEQLKLPKLKYSVPVSALNGLATHTRHLITATIQSTNKKYETEVQCLTIPVISHLIPTQPIPRNIFSLPSKIQLADPEFFKPRPIDMLLGSAPSLDLFTTGQYQIAGKQGSNIILQKTRLGWVIGGSLSPTLPHKRHQAFNTQIATDLRRFLEIEEGPTRKLSSPEELSAEEHFQQHHYRTSTGRDSVALPFRSTPPGLGESRETALKRLHSLEGRLNKNPDLNQEYRAVIREYLSLQHMTKTTDIESPGYYLPHHAVIKESSMTTKVRVVFDGSSRTSNGISLNETLMIGPTIQDDLFSLILRFRCHQYVLTGDIEKMYRQFLIHPDDRKYQRILWKDEEGDIATYELNTVTFGLSAAPFLAIRCLQQLARDEAWTYPIASRILQEDMYVDDLLTGFNYVEDAQLAQVEITQLLLKGGLNIRQWASNDAAVLREVPPEHINQHLQLDSDKTIKTLGISWNSEVDAIQYKTKPITLTNTITKRNISSTVPSIFDPLGLLGPVILKAKNIIQQLWSAKVDWDESITFSIRTLWIDLCTEFPLINDLQFDRKVIIKNKQQIQLHGFCDASNVGYGACIYIKSIDPQGSSQVNLLCSRSRVASLQSPVRTPRLELHSAKNNELEWRLRMEICNLWQHGPSWLQETLDHWPQQPIIQNPTDDSEKKQIICLHTTLDHSLFKNFNSFTKLIRTFAYCFRLIDVVKRRRRWQGQLSAIELQKTRDRLLQLVQSSVFSTELQQLKLSTETGKPHHHKLSQLNPSLDENGLSRVGGRLNRAELTATQKHPIILPKNHIITDLIIQEEHLKNFHSGVQGTLYNTRQSYWILDGRNQIRRVIRKCITCVRANPPPTNYLMGHLPFLNCVVFYRVRRYRR
ncbi:uncharacterized protein LOC135169143 [Diachasmimorpha longicaudata]|uniref:uncharacterized protein LOC135169143 n=1 Tax=Diachasmimorpha longicaudata TaxID=58733 RepID=UPI0030B9157D